MSFVINEPVMSMRLSIGIVIYHPDLGILKKTLTHLEMAAAGIETQCYLVNNASDKKTFTMLMQFIGQFKLDIKLINNVANTGYGAGNNLAINKTSAKYHLVLNPDAFLHQDALHKALTYMDQEPKVGLLCPKILNEDGSQQFVHRQHATLWDMFLRGCAPDFIQRLFRRRMHAFELKHLDWSCMHNIESPSGCCMLFRTSVLKQVGGFDERYFMYYEDSDMGQKIARVSKILYLPSFVVTHLWERAARKSWKMKWIMIKSGFIYFRKWGGWF